jgi:hypothetical protein
VCIPLTFVKLCKWRYNSSSHMYTAVRSVTVLVTTRKKSVAVKTAALSSSTPLVQPCSRHEPQYTQRLRAHLGHVLVKHCHGVLQLVQWHTRGAYSNASSSTAADVSAKLLAMAYQTKDETSCGLLSIDTSFALNRTVRVQAVVPHDTHPAIPVMFTSSGAAHCVQAAVPLLF